MLFIEVELVSEGIKRKHTIRLDHVHEFFPSSVTKTTIICRKGELPLHINEDYESFKNRIANIAIMRDNVWQRT